MLMLTRIFHLVLNEDRMDRIKFEIESYFDANRKELE